ncbi:MAG: antirestriction protein ArdA [Caldilineaceae bacterium]
MSIETTIPRIYVACLAAYNSGILHGVWIDALHHNSDAIMEEVQAMLKSSPVPGAEEWAIHGYEGFAGVHISESEGFLQVHEYALFVNEHGELGAKVMAHCGSGVDAAEAILDEDYSGCYASIADFAEEMIRETTEIPQNLQYYIDYARMAADWEMSGDIFTIETAHDEVHVFWNR